MRSWSRTSSMGVFILLHSILHSNVLPQFHRYLLHPSGYQSVQHPALQECQPNWPSGVQPSTCIIRHLRSATGPPREWGGVGNRGYRYLGGPGQLQAPVPMSYLRPSLEMRVYSRINLPNTGFSCMTFETFVSY